MLYQVNRNSISNFNLTNGFPNSVKLEYSQSSSRLVDSYIELEFINVILPKSKTFIWIYSSRIRSHFYPFHRELVYFSSK